MTYAFTDQEQIEELMQEDAMFPWLADDCMADDCMADETTDGG